MLVRRPCAYAPLLPFGASLGAMLLLMTAPGRASAQGSGPSSLADIKKMAGTVVAEAASPVAETPMAIRGYRVERVALASPIRAMVEGKAADVSEAWHVTVRFARPLTVRNQAFSLVIDGQWCGFLAEAPNLMSADAVCFNPRLMKNGAAVGVTYRGLSIERPEGDETVNPEAALEGEGETPIHYSTVRLRLETGR